MAVTLLVARLVLAVVFLVAGLAKLADLGGARRTIAEFGLPDPLARPLGLLLPTVELAVVVALIPARSAWLGAACALALLLLFIAAIGVNLARGRAPACRCFGQIHPAPVGRLTLLRNGALAALSAFVVVAGRVDAGVDLPAWLGGQSATARAEIFLAVVFALLAGGGWVLLTLWHRYAQLEGRLDLLEEQLAASSSPAAPSAARSLTLETGLAIGAPAPTFSLIALSGQTLTLEQLCAPGLPVVLFFTDPGCGPCNALLPAIGAWQQQHAGTLTCAVISRGTPEANRARSAEHGVSRVLLQQDREVAEAYQCSGTPSAVLITPDGTIGSPVALGSGAIRTLVAAASVRPHPPSPPIQVATARIGIGGDVGSLTVH
ncbi:MAG TPA: MauE/DoxX family redox-associated membrane protein [Chloroflexota bacterium]|nr:MauE/DoxX family redox-associated membrane protein [Chloroflexota bacterium]